MADRSYGPGCDGCRSARNGATGLGFIPIATIAGVAIDLGKKYLANGGSDRTSCPGQIPPSILGSVISHATLTEQATWDRLIKGTRPAWYTTLETVPLDQLSFGIAGGGDCKVTSNEGRALVAFAQQQVQKYAHLALSSSGTLPDSSVYPVEGGPTVSPIIRELPNEHVIQDAGGDPSTLDKILAVLKNAGQAGITAATTTAAAGTYGAMSPAQQADIERQLREQRTSGMIFGLPKEVAIGGGLLLGAVLFTRAHK